MGVPMMERSATIRAGLVSKMRSHLASFETDMVLSDLQEPEANECIVSEE